MAEEVKAEGGKDSTPESTKSIKEATPEVVAEAEAAQKAAEEVAKTEGVKEGDKTPEAPKVDYKAELESTKKKLEQAEFLLKKKNIDDKKKKEESDPEKSPDSQEGDESKTDPAEVDKKLEEFKLAQLQDFISDELKSMSEDPDERELIELHFKNSIKRTGDTKEAVKEDLASARYLANRKRFEKLEAELNAKDKSTPEKGGGSGGQKIEGDAPKETPALSDSDQQLLRRYGLKPEDIKK